MYFTWLMASPLFVLLFSSVSTLEKSTNLLKSRLNEKIYFFRKRENRFVDIRLHELVLFRTTNVLGQYYLTSHKQYIDHNILTKDILRSQWFEIVELNLHTTGIYKIYFYQNIISIIMLV